MLSDLNRVPQQRDSLFDEAQRRRTLHAVIASCLLGMTAPLALQPGIARAQPVKLEPRQPGPSQAYLDLEAWCAEHRPGIASTGSAATAEERRLRAVQASLAPGFDPGRRQDGIALLRAYQLVLEQNRPNQALAATYLALISTKPITFEIVERTNALLCVSSTQAFARAVANQAEAERLQMSR